MERRRFLEALVIGGSVSLSGCMGALGGSDDEESSITVVSNTATVVQLRHPTWESDVPRNPPQINVLCDTENGDPQEASVGVTFDDTALFDGTVRFQEQTDGPLALVFEPLQAGEYEVSVTFDDNSLTETVEITSEEIDQHRQTGYHFRYDGELTFREQHEQ